MRELETQVLLVPALEEQISNLEKDKSSLVKKVTELTHELAIKSHELDKKLLPEQIKMEKKTSGREVGVQCVPRTRDVAVLHLLKKTDAGTNTGKVNVIDKGTDPVLEEKVDKIISLKDLDNATSSELPVAMKSTKGTQTLLTHSKPIEKSDACLQTSLPVKAMAREIGIIAKPKISDVGMVAKVQTRESGDSEHTIKDLLCDKCQNIRTKSVGVGYGNVKEPSPSPGAGLANRSKSFDFSNKKHTRSIGVSTVPPVQKMTATKQVGTVEVTVPRKNVGVNTSKSTVDVGLTADLPAVKSECEDCKKRMESSGTSEIFTSTVEATSPVVKKAVTKEGSKIPRPTTAGSLPGPSNKKLTRQNTYSKSLAEAVSGVQPQSQ